MFRKFDTRDKHKNVSIRLLTILKRLPTICESRQCSQYSDSLRAGQPRVQIPTQDFLFSKFHSLWLQCPPSFLFNGYRDSLLELKWSGNKALPLLPRLRMSGATPLLPSCAIMARMRMALLFVPTVCSLQTLKTGTY